MRFSATIIAGFVAVAAAAASTTVSGSAPAVPTQTTSYTPAQVACLDVCAKKTDTASKLACQAECFGNPAPTVDMVNKTTQCVAACPKGDGTPAATDKYTKCMNNCITAQFFSSTLGSNGNGAAATGSGASGTGSSNASPTGSSSSDSDSGPDPSESGTASGTATGTGAAASSTSSSGASGLNVAGFSGLFVLAVAAFAL